MQTEKLIMLCMMVVKNPEQDVTENRMMQMLKAKGRIILQIRIN